MPNTVTINVTTIINNRGNPIFALRFYGVFLFASGSLGSLKLLSLNAKKKLSEDTLTFINTCTNKTKNILHLPPSSGFANAK